MGVLGVLLAALTACTPADEPIAALAVQNGTPVGLLYPCRYRLSGDSHRGSLTIGFTTADFDRIGGDQVLVADGRDRMKVVSRDAFVRTARATCE